MFNSLINAVSGKEESDIVIIGKGSSIDAITLSALTNKIIINVNDSESIIKGDIGVFHHDWVLNRFKSTDPACKLYVTDCKVPNGMKYLPARYASLDQERELFLERFFDKDQIWLENATVISCIRVANELARALGRRKRVFLLGFDFTSDNGYSALAETFKYSEDTGYVGSTVHSQETYLEKLIKERDRLNVDIYHIGNRPCSMFTAEAFNALIASSAIEKSHEIKFNSPKHDNNTKIVAEITTNHFGDRERLKAMILLAKQSGADYIKLQKRDVDTFYSSETLNSPFKSPFGRTFRDYRIGLELKIEDFQWVDIFCKKIGISWFASVLDEPSFEFIKQLNPSLIKLPSAISTRKSYLEKVGREWDLGLVVSTGMTGPEYEKFIIKSFKRAKEIYVLQCTSAYPTPENETGIGIVRHYRDLSLKNPRLIPGYSSHDVGSLCSQMAIAAGAKMIEKHVKLGTVQWSHFDEVALDLSNGQFKRFVSDVRRAERIVGSETKKIFDSENHKY